MPGHKKATPEFKRLLLGMEVRHPACADDPRFVDDNSDVRELAELCAGCPLMGPCHVYAAKAKPPGGVWAGRRWGGQTQVGRPKKEAA